MNISFPRMGYSYIAFKWLIENIGHECVVPPEPSKRTLDLGVRHAPEFACIPFKILLGTYLEVAEMGAEMVITSGGVGPCRAGYYWVMHQKLLDELGVNLRIIGFEPPLHDIGDFWRKLKLVWKTGGVTFKEFVRALHITWEKLKAIDDLEMLSFKVRPYEINRGETTRTLWNALELVDRANSFQEIFQAREEGTRLLHSIDKDLNRDPLRVGIIGEIYVVLEPAANHYLQVMLGEAGVEIDRSIYITGYCGRNTIKTPDRELFALARPYLNEAPIGGHGTNSIGETVLYARRGFDGVIQLAPFACIPEVVAKGILPRVSQELDIPVLTFFIDEQTGKAGIQTRIEAFIDLLQERREKRRRQAGKMAG